MSKSREKQYSVSYVPTIKISHKYLVSYTTLLSDNPNKKNNYSNFFTEDEKVTTYKGEITEGSKKRLREACELMFAISTEKHYKHPTTGKNLKFRIGLLTLTLAAAQRELTDREIKQGLLEPYLRKLKKYGLKNYVWKAERQKNGNIHFHIFIDCFIDFQDARNIWNREQSKFHFINDFELKHGHRNPNGTDIKPINTQDGMIVYMVKYMMKEEEVQHQGKLGRDYSEKAKGKVWDCSKPLKEKNTTADFATNTEYEAIMAAVEKGQIREFKKDYATIYYFQEPRVWQYVPPSIYDRYRNFLSHVQRSN